MITCALVWSDGWGDHTCHLPDEHDGDHRCTCDATRDADRETDWDAELHRQERLREEDRQEDLQNELAHLYDQDREDT